MKGQRTIPWNLSLITGYLQRKGNIEWYTTTFTVHYGLGCCEHHTCYRNSTAVRYFISVSATPAHLFPNVVVLYESGKKSSLSETHRRPHLPLHRRPLYFHRRPQFSHRRPQYFHQRPRWPKKPGSDRIRIRIRIRNTGRDFGHSYVCNLF